MSSNSRERGLASPRCGTIFFFSRIYHRVRCRSKRPVYFSWSSLSVEIQRSLNWVDHFAQCNASRNLFRRAQCYTQVIACNQASAWGLKTRLSINIFPMQLSLGAYLIFRGYKLCLYSYTYFSKQTCQSYIQFQWRVQGRTPLFINRPKWGPKGQNKSFGRPGSPLF